MNVQCVQRVADLMGHTGGEQGERFNAFALDDLKGFLLLLGGIIDNNRQSAGAFADECCGGQLLN